VPFIDPIRGHLIAARTWLTVFLLPGYAPDLNPVEAVWSQVKRSPANLGAASFHRHAALVCNHLKSLQYRAPTPDGFIAETGPHPEPPQPRPF